MKFSALARFLCLLLLAGSPAYGEDLTFEPENFAISKPEGWLEVPEARVAPVVVSMGDPDRNNIVAIISTPSPAKYVPFDQKFATGFDKGFDSSSGGKKISGKFTTFQGQPAYERFGTMPVNGREASTFVRVMLVEGKFLMVQGLDFSGNVSENATVMKAADSFRFLRPPSKPDLAYQMGYFFGQYGGAIAVAVAVIVGGFASLRSLFKRKKPRQPGEPPPLR